MSDKLDVVGKAELVDFPALGLASVPAKIDTGADSSAIWASDIRLEKSGDISFVLFGESSEFYTAERLTFSEYERVKVSSASGEQLRYKVPLVVKVGGRRIRGWFTLADRSELKFPVLVGRRTLHKKFVVDVSRAGASQLAKSASRDVLVLGVSPSRVQEFFNALAVKTDASFSLASLSQLMFFASDSGVNVIDITGGRDIASYALAYFKTSRKYYEFAASAASYLRTHNVKFIDQELADFVSYDKLTEAFKLALAGLAVPASVSGSNKILLANLAKASDFTGWPLVIKEIHEDRGRQNYLLENPSDVEKILASAGPGEHFILQKFIRNDGFLRCYVFGGKLALAVKRANVKNPDPKKAHLNNPAGSANASLVALADVPATASDLAIRAAMCLNRQVAGVDLIYDLDGKCWRILEVNSAPQLRTGSFQDTKLAAFAKFIKQEIQL